MKRKKPEDVDATRVRTEPEPAGPSDTQLFSEAVRDAEENEMNRTTTDGKRRGNGASGDAPNLAASSTRIVLDVPATRDDVPAARGATGGGALLYLLAGAIAGAITLVAVSMTTSP